MSVSTKPQNQSESQSQGQCEGLGESELDAVFGLVVDGLGRLGLADVVARCQRYRGMLDSVESIKLAGVVGADGDSRGAARAAGRGGKTSKREARRRGKRAAAVAKNAALADKMASGDLSGEQVDAIADASAKSDGAAAVDDDLIDSVANATADQSKKIADDWLADRADAESTQTEHDRQRRLRRASRYTNKDGLGVISIEGDQVTIDTIWAEMLTEANRLYLADGGRDVAGRLHPRTSAQRRFDALAKLILGDDAASNDISNGEMSDGDISSGDPARKQANGNMSSKQSPANRQQARRTRQPATVVVMVDAAKFGPDGAHLVATQLGVGPIADSLLANYLPNCDLVGAVFGVDGQPLWLGRTVRNASLSQRLALAIRDQGCAQCGADWRRCHAHHRIPWNAPAKGQTNIDDLVLLCPSCHRALHDANQTLYQDPNSGRWKQRPATAAETPPRRPQPNGQRNNARREPVQRT